MRFFVACIVLGCAWVCHGALGVVSDTVPKLTLQPASTKKTAMHLFDAQLGCVPTLKLDDQYPIAALRESRNLFHFSQLHALLTDIVFQVLHVPSFCPCELGSVKSILQDYYFQLQAVILLAVVSPRESSCLLHFQHLSGAFFLGHLSLRLWRYAFLLLKHGVRDAQHKPAQCIVFKIEKVKPTARPSFTVRPRDTTNVESITKNSALF